LECYRNIKTFIFCSLLLVTDDKSKVDGAKDYNVPLELDIYHIHWFCKLLGVGVFAKKAWNNVAMLGRKDFPDALDVTIRKCIETIGLKNDFN